MDLIYFSILIWDSPIKGYLVGDLLAIASGNLLVIARFTYLIGLEIVNWLTIGLHGFMNIGLQVVDMKHYCRISVINIHHLVGPNCFLLWVITLCLAYKYFSILLFEEYQ